MCCDTENVVSSCLCSVTFCSKEWPFPTDQLFFLNKGLLYHDMDGLLDVIFKILFDSVKDPVMTHLSLSSIFYLTLSGIRSPGPFTVI